MCERWAGNWTKTATYWPPALLAIAALLSHPAGLLNRGSWGPSLCWDLVLTPWTATTDSKLWFPINWLPVAPGYIIVWRPPASVSVASAPNSTHQGYPLISSTGCTCYLHRSISYLTAWPGRRSICYIRSPNIEFDFPNFFANLLTIYLNQCVISFDNSLTSSLTL